MTDPSFADVESSPATSIISGWKGVITFRHDTANDNSCHYDFRNCKFRRWEFDVDAWSSGTTYAKGDWCTYNSRVWQSFDDGNIGHTPNDSGGYWVGIINLAYGNYLSHSPDDTGYYDYLTFNAIGVSNSYEDSVFGNHIGKSYASILSNKVFLIKDGDEVINNDIGNGSFGNTFLGGQKENKIGNACANNLLGNSESNVIGAYMTGNIMRGYIKNNNIKSTFDGCRIGNDFGGNNVEDYVMGLVIGASFSNNKVLYYSVDSSIGFGASYSVFGVYFATIGNNFRNNVCEGNVNLGGDLTSATHIYGDYTCTIFKDSTGATKLSYIDGSGDTVVVAVTS
jgi:hypothetical protein